MISKIIFDMSENSWFMLSKKRRGMLYYNRIFNEKEMDSGISYIVSPEAVNKYYTKVAIMPCRVKDNLSISNVLFETQSPSIRTYLNYLKFRQSCRLNRVIPIVCFYNNTGKKYINCHTGYPIYYEQKKTCNKETS